MMGGTGDEGRVWGFVALPLTSLRLLSEERGNFTIMSRVMTRVSWMASPGYIPGGAGHG